MDSNINLDANASLGAMEDVVHITEKRVEGGLHNPSSIHSDGQKARALIEWSRRSIKKTIGASGDWRLVFCSGATEANNTAVLSRFWDICKSPIDFQRYNVVTLGAEHPSVLEPFKRWKSLGCEVRTVLKPTVEAFKEAVDENTVLVAVMFANNETGEVYPILPIAKVIREISKQAWIHTDCAQAIGKLGFSLDSLPVDSVSISGHKIGSLGGVGALLVNDRVKLNPLILGGPQEVRHRAGTENVRGVVSFGVACELLEERCFFESDRYKTDWLNLVQKELANLRVNFIDSCQLPNTLSLTVFGIDASDLIVACDMRGLSISSGSACASGKPEPSHVLRATGMIEEDIKSTVRISFPMKMKPEEVQCASVAFVDAVKAMKS